MSITLYHYTTADGLKGIVQSRRINSSVQNSRRADVRYGEGVYLTALPPNTSKFLIALNNYDGMNLSKLISDGKVDYFIKIVFSRNDPNLKDCANDRSVWLYDGDINLNHFQVKVGQL